MSFDNVQYFAEIGLGLGNVWAIYLYEFTKFMVIKVIRNIM